MAEAASIMRCKLALADQQRWKDDSLLCLVEEGFVHLAPLRSFLNAWALTAVTCNGRARAPRPGEETRFPPIADDCR